MGVSKDFLRMSHLNRNWRMIKWKPQEAEAGQAQQHGLHCWDSNVTTRDSSMQGRFYTFFYNLDVNTNMKIFQNKQISVPEIITWIFVAAMFITIETYNNWNFKLQNISIYLDLKDILKDDANTHLLTWGRCTCLGEISGPQKIYWGWFHVYWVQNRIQ